MNKADDYYDRFSTKVSKNEFDLDALGLLWIFSSYILGKACIIGCTFQVPVKRI